MVKRTVNCLYHSTPPCVPSFLRIGPAELIISQLLWGLSAAAFVAQAEATLSRVPRPPLAELYTPACDKPWGWGHYYPVDAYRWPAGLSLNARMPIILSSLDIQSKRQR